MASSLTPVTGTSNKYNISNILDYETLKSYNKENLCSIYVTGSKAKPVTGIIDPDQTSKFVVSAKYEPLIDQSSFMTRLQPGINLAGAAWGNPQLMIHSLRLSERSFKGFDADKEFQVKLSVPVLHENDNPAQLACRIMSYACGTRMPSMTNTGGYSSDVESRIKQFGKNAASEVLLYAPNNYHITYHGEGGGLEDKPHNSTTIAVGTRFLYTDVLVTNVTAEFSDTVYHDGKPTFLQMAVSFVFWRQIDLSVLESFMRVRSENMMYR